MRNWKIAMAGIVLALAALFIVACGDDDDDGNGDGNGEPLATATTADDGEEPADGQQPDDGEQPGNGGGPEDSLQNGSATLTVGDETYTFDGYGCAFGEETQNENVEFSSTAFGESATGARTQLSVDITLGIHAVTLNDIDDFENPSVAWDGIVDGEIQIDGDNISAQATFDDRTTPDVLEEIPGTFEGTC